MEQGYWLPRQFLRQTQSPVPGSEAGPAQIPAPSVQADAEVDPEPDPEPEPKPEEDAAPMCGSAPVDPDRADKNDIAFYRTLDETRKHLQMQPSAFFDQLCQWDEEECVIAASTSGKDEGTSTAQSGLVQGHAYSVIECKKIEDGHTYAMRTHLRSDFGCTGALHTEIIADL